MPIHKSHSEPNIDLKKRLTETWEKMPSDRRREIEKAHRVHDIAGAVYNFRVINDALNMIKTTIKFREQPPSYANIPMTGELRVVSQS